MQPKSRWAAWLSSVSSSSVQMALSTQIASSFIVLCFLAVGSGSARPAAAPFFLARGGRYPGQIEMPMVRADEDVNVGMYLFYLPSVLRMVSAGIYTTSGDVDWTCEVHSGTASVLFRQCQFACAACLMAYVALANQCRPRPPSGRPVQVTIRGWRDVVRHPVRHPDGLWLCIRIGVQPIFS